MSDPFTTDHGNWDAGSAGRTSGFGAGVSAGYDQQYQVDSAYSVEDQVWDRWSKSLSNLERATGQKFDMPMDYTALNNYVRASQGEDPSWSSQAITFNGLDPAIALKEREPFIKANDTIKQLNDPNIRSMEDIVKEVLAERQGYAQRSAEVSETGGFMAGLGQFVGAVGGSFSERDPLLLGTLGFGGFGKTAAARIASEMGIIGGVEAVNQYGAVEPTRAVIGEEPGSPLMNVLFAMAGAGILRGGVEGLGKFVQGRQAAALERNTLDLTDEMRVAFEAMPQSPSARAGLHLLDAQDDFTKANPYGTSEPASRRFIGELEDVQRVMSGTADTAIARFLPDMPIDTQKLDADSLIVQAERPVVFEELTTAQTRLAEIDEEINRVGQEISDLSVSDAIARIDQASGDIMRSLEEALSNPQLLAKQREAIIIKMDQIVESLGGAEAVAKNAINATIKPKKVLQSLRQSRKAAVKQFRTARKQFDTALEDINRIAVAKERIAHMRTVGDLGSQAKLLDEPPGEILRHDNVEAVVAATETASEVVDDVARGIVNDFAEAEIQAAEPIETKTVGRFYHGTPVKGLKRISPSKEGGFPARDPASTNNGIYFTPSKKLAWGYSQGKGDIHEVELITKNPKTVSYAEIVHVSDKKLTELKAEGYDSLKTKDGKEIVVFEQSQIKYADADWLDLGNGIRIPKDFILNLEDEAGNSFTMSADDIMRDMKDDLALEEAVKVCSI